MPAVPDLRIGLPVNCGAGRPVIHEGISGLWQEFDLGYPDNVVIKLEARSETLFIQALMGLVRLVVLAGLVSACATTTEPAPTSPRPLSPGASGQGLRFAWPVLKGQITRGFLAGSKRHQGLDISGQKNSPIFAAETGRVIYTGQDFNGYGKLVIIEHDGDRWASFYAHLNQFLVREGQWVKRGEKIALMGRTGRATGVHLHFEIRHQLRPIDPLPHLSSQQILNASRR